MSAKRISQREARDLRKRVLELEREKARRACAYASDYPGGVNIGSIAWADPTATVARLFTARQLGHGVIALPSPDFRTINFYALKDR